MTSSVRNIIIYFPVFATCNLTCVDGVFMNIMFMGIYILFIIVERSSLTLWRTDILNRRDPF